VISGAGHIVKDTSASVLTLSGANTLSGNVTVNTGTVVVTQNNGLGNNTGTATVASGAVLDIQNASIGNETLNLNGGTLRVSTGSSSWSGPVNLGAASTLSTTGTAMTLSGLVDDNGYGITLDGSGSFTLSNASNTINTLATGAGVTIDSFNMKNSVALAVGLINATGNVTIANTAGLTLMSGQGITTASGNIVLAGTRFINAAGVNALMVSNGQSWQVWSANPAPLETLANGGDDTGNLVNNFVQYNATYGSSQVLGTGKGLLYTFAPVLTGRLVGTITKHYDATTSASVGAANLLVTGLLNGDVLSLSQNSNAVFTTAGTGTSIVAVGTGKNVDVNAAIVTATNGNKIIYGYQLSNPVMSGPGEITKAPIILTMSKTYDAATLFTTSNAYMVTGLVAGDTVLLNGGTATVASANAATYNSLSTNSFSITSDKYTLDGATYNVTINKKDITITAQATYSGSTALVPTTSVVGGLVNSETLVPTGVTAQFANVANNGNNFVTALTSNTGTANLNNYSVTLASSPVTIERKLITLNGTLTATKTYDGNVSASVITTGVTPSVVFGSDDVSVNTISGTYDQRHVSATRVVTVTGVTLTGTSANNYAWDTASGQTASGTIVLRNGSTASGTAITGTITPSTGFNCFPAYFTDGAFATIGGTLDVTFIFSAG
jgi:autotransporter-associated beta strand protein